MAGQRQQRTSPIRDIRRGDFNGMGQAVGVNDEMTLDPGDFLTRVIALFFSRLRVFDALRISDAEACLWLPTKARSHRANPIFLRPAPAG